MHSAIYQGSIRHRRFAPRPHQFSYRLFMLYLDLDELDQVFEGRWFWSCRRAALGRFRRQDYLGDPTIPLHEAVRDLVLERTGKRLAGPIRLLTHLRYFGYGFNPVSFYYCYDPTGQRVETVVAEVPNTPWRESHCYVLDEAGAPLTQPTDGKTAQPDYQHYASDKVLHVSPFMPMDLQYRWGFGAPDDRLNVFMALTSQTKVFDASLRLHRRPITGATLAGALLRFPLMTVQVIGAIHWQALRLWLKRVPIHTHPAKL